MNTLNIYPSNNAGLDCAPHKLASAEKSRIYEDADINTGRTSHVLQTSDNITLGT